MLISEPSRLTTRILGEPLIHTYLRNINIPRAMNDEPTQPLSIVVVIIIYISDIYYSIKYVYTLASAGLHIIVHTVCSRMLGVER